MHGFGIITNHLLKEKFPNFKFNYYLSWLMTFIYINFTFIFFRSETIHQATTIIKKMINLNNINSFDNFDKFFKLLNLNNDYKLLHCFLIFLSFLIVFFLKNTFDIGQKFNNKKIYFFISLFAFIIGIFSIGDGNEFIYFKF